MKILLELGPIKWIGFKWKEEELPVVVFGLEVFYDGFAIMDPNTSTTINVAILGPYCLQTYYIGITLMLPVIFFFTQGNQDPRKQYKSLKSYLLTNKRKTAIYLLISILISVYLTIVRYLIILIIFWYLYDLTPINGLVYKGNDWKLRFSIAHDIIGNIFFNVAAVFLGYIQFRWILKDMHEYLPRQEPERT